ncbi:translation elongation factor [Sulfolobales archaeon HS-7]|nr:translation elongation factor [Sulfolobales archaeon HS-7]
MKGYISAVISSQPEEALKVADKLGKRKESEGMAIYYKRVGEDLRSILVPRLEKLMEVAEAITLSSSFYLVVGREFSWVDGELALLAEASGTPGVIISDNPDFSKVIKELSVSKFLGDFKEVDVEVGEAGYVYLDRVFNVRGVGTVGLGFSRTQIRTHDRFISVPSMKQVDVKSIQVLDEDVDSVPPGIRVGLALRNVTVDEIKDDYLLLRDTNLLTREVREVSTFKWSTPVQNVHVVCGGISVTGIMNAGKIELDRPVMKGSRCVILNLNARTKTPRILGFGYT